ncbi:hypothetical protein [Prosthecobacter fluviatilis]|uniref:Uncharacterized protein n=1 Tax=Prosthecobacter fluviatilis TaxID=445931 RepID=A0ABW0KP56_9BACT
MSIRKSLLCAVIFIAGLAFGQFISRPMYDRNGESRENLVRLKCLHGLAEDFRRAHERWPQSLPELQSWCQEDELRRIMFDRSSNVSAKGMTFVSWKLLKDPQSGLFSGFTSGKQETLRCEYQMDAEGRATLIK